MAKIYHIDLTEEERVHLTSIVNKRKSSCELAKRSSILLAADRLGEKKWSDKQISETYLVSTRTIERLRECLVNDGLSVALAGKPRINSHKIKFDGEVEAKLIALRCSDPEPGYSSWTLSLLADKMVALSYVESISYVTVHRILKKTKLNRGVLKNG